MKEFESLIKRAEGLLARLERLVPGETICMITDGITEAANAAGQLYGHARLERVITRMNGAPPAELVEAIRADVLAFVAGAEPSDDMSVLALRWMGPLVAA